MTPKQRRIIEAFDAHDAAEPAISTERLFQMVCDDIGCDHAEVADALYQDKDRMIRATSSGSASK